MTENEWTTRKTRIDKKLISLSQPWEIIHYSDSLVLNDLTNHAVEEFPTENGPADYALFVNGQLMAILEAKRVSVSPQNVLEQAKRYSKGAKNTLGKWGEYKVPFVYSSNGTKIWFADLRDEVYYSRELMDFHTPDALSEMFLRKRSDYIKFLGTTLNNIEKLRPCQKEAVKSIEKSIIENKRKMMLAMATGTGKTFTTVSLIYRLIKSGFARRILFLVDRRALAAQASQAFSSFQTPSGNKFNQEYEVFSQKFRREDFEEGEKFDIGVMPNEYLTAPNPSHTFVYVSTIQRMSINLFGREGCFGQSESDPEIEENAGKIDIPIHAFDVIIADECHRGYTSKDTSIWRRVLNHFDSVKVGLTATPASHTVGYFGNPVFRYTVEQAVTDGFLVDYEAVKIKSDVRINGIFLEEGERVAVKDKKTGLETIDQLEDERQFDSTKIEKDITSPDSNRKIIEEIAKYAAEHEKKTGRFPKMLIFAANDIAHISHADQIVNIARDVFGQGDEFVQKITGSPSVDRPLQKIRMFRNRPNPRIVVTVDMLSTGVDIPALEYIVFMRPVKSRILWTQMLGRGTRKCVDINKEFFTVFDCFDGTLIEYFKDSTDFDIKVMENKGFVDISQIIENIWNNVERDYNTNRLLKRLRRIDATMSAEARMDFSKFIEDGAVNLFADKLKHNLEHDFMKTMEILRNSEFQDLMKNYKRAITNFYVSHSTIDNVSSEVMFKYQDKHLKPEDYLEMFSKFVSENEDKMEALKILFKSPRKWNSNVLREIRNEMAKNSFDEEKLRLAHKQSGHKALADIISMIKKAKNEQIQMFTASERVEKAIEKLLKNSKFNDEQTEWLEYIKEHLIINLAIDKDSFDLMPILERHGGLSKARKVFGNQFDEVIEKINEAVAA